MQPTLKSDYTGEYDSRDENNLLVKNKGYQKSHIISKDIDIALFIFRYMILTIIDIEKTKYGLPSKIFFINIFFYFFFLLSTSVFNTFLFKDSTCKTKLSNILMKLKINICFLFILVLDISELVAYIFNKSPINTQAINAISIEKIYKEFPDFTFYIVMVVSICIVLIFLPFYKLIITIPNISLIFTFFNLFFTFTFSLSILHDFRNENNLALLDSNEYSEWLKDLLLKKTDQPPKVLRASNQVKNLILVELESFANEFIQNSVMCPNLNNFSKEFEFISPIYSVPYSTWSTAGAILTQTGIPQILPEYHWKSRSEYNMDYIAQVKGIPDILSSINYKLKYSTNGENSIMGFDKWVKSRNYSRIYTAKDDDDLYSFFTEKYLTEIDNDIRKNNAKYLLFIVNTNTHSPYNIPKWCNLKFPKIEHAQKCFYCVDNLLGKFVNKFLELKMDEHTLLAFFSDHLPFGSNFNPPVNQLFFLFPGLKKIDPTLKIKDEITYYDFAPSILDLIGIKEYVPEFPFGRSIYIHKNTSYKTGFNRKHYKPNTYDLALLYKFLHIQKGKNINSTYNFNVKFKCYTETKHLVYYSDTPCSVITDH